MHVQQEERPGGVWAVDVPFYLAAGEVDKELEASLEGDSELAVREEVFCEGLTVVLHDVFPCDPAEGGAHGDGPEFGGVGRVLVESHEMAGGEEGDDGFGQLVVEDEAQDFCEAVEIGEGGGE